MNRIEIDTICANIAEKALVDSVGCEIFDIIFYTSNSFKRAVHCWDRPKHYDKKKNRNTGIEYLAIIDDSCNIVSITRDKHPE
jgi:hypothetical protein